MYEQNAWQVVSDVISGRRRGCRDAISDLDGTSWSVEFYVRHMYASFSQDLRECADGESGNKWRYLYDTRGRKVP